MSQDAWQRDRPDRGDRPGRRRRAALLPAARGAVRPGRRRHLGGAAPPLRGRAGQRAGEPGVADDGDDRPLSRRAACPTAGPRSSRSTRRVGAPGRDRPDRRAGGDLGPRARGQPVRRGARAVGAGAFGRPPPTPPGWTRPCTRSRTRCARLGVLLWPFIPSSRERLLAAIGDPAGSSWERAGLGLLAAGTEVAQPPPLFPTGRAAGGVIDTHAHLDACAEHARAAGAARRRNREWGGS